MHNALNNKRTCAALRLSFPTYISTFIKRLVKPRGERKYGTVSEIWANTNETPHTLLMNFVYDFQEGMSIKIIIIFSPSPMFDAAFFVQSRSTSRGTISNAVCPLSACRKHHFLLYEKNKHPDERCSQSQFQYWLFGVRSWSLKPHTY